MQFAPMNRNSRLMQLGLALCVLLMFDLQLMVEGATTCPASCPSGQYREPSSQTCKDCPLGHYCSSSSSDSSECPAGTYNSQFNQTSPLSCLACGTGQYSAAGSSVCSDCPLGFHCPNPAGTPIACPSGYFSTSKNAVSCTICPAGSECPQSTAAPVECPSGSTSSAGQTQCTPCSAGTYAITNLKCQTCPDNTFCVGGTSAYTNCPSGSWSTAGSSSCSTCPTSSYYNGVGCVPCSSGFTCDGMSASICPAGSYCPSATQKLVCPPGSFSLAGSSSCTLCGAGSYNNLPQQSSCQKCGAGSYSSQGSTECTLCPLGSSCPNAASAPVSCADGTYSSSLGASTCTSCPSGYFCPDKTTEPIQCPSGTISAGSRKSCTSCPNGTFANPSQSECTKCPAGSYCPFESSSPITCPSNSWSLSGASDCTTCSSNEYFDGTKCASCPAGSYCNGLVSLSCPNGYFSASGSVSCTPCPAGYSCPDKSKSPVACKSSEFSKEADGFCTLCPAGYACPTPSSTSACPAGSYSLDGQTSCTVCPSGYACPFTTSTGFQCPVGTYSAEGATSCSPCPAGYECPDGKKSSMNQCASGSFSPGGFQSCKLCPSGYSCPNNDDYPAEECPAGYYSTGGMDSCLICPAGFSCASNSKSPEACKSGFYSTEGSTVCSACPIGYSCPTADQLPVACPVGQYASTKGQTSCTICPANSYCPFTTSDDNFPCLDGTYSLGGQAECLACPAGSACFSVDGVFTIKECEAGTYSITGSSLCTDCPAGYECPISTALPMPCPFGTYSPPQALSCSPCPAGHSCLEPAKSPITCPVGFYSAQGDGACHSCHPGYSCPAGSTSPSPTDSRCPDGSYCPDGKNIYLCPAGTYSIGAGGMSIESNCKTCPGGHYCPAGTTSTGVSSQLCPSGAYCPPGTQSSTQYLCLAGTYNENEGAESIDYCLECPVGQYCTLGSSEGRHCPAGYFCGLGTLDYESSPCPSGTFSNTSRLSSMDGCYDCPEGHYCYAGTSIPTSCPAGTFRAVIKGESEADCELCPAGYYCDGATVTPSPCPAGYYCPLGTSYPFEYPCPAGTYAPKNESISLESCLPCPAGYSCIMGSGSADNPPEICRPGFYCPIGTKHPSQYPCLPGTFSMRLGLNKSSDCTPCPAGSYCLGGNSRVSGACDLGHYCPQGTTYPYQFNCPGGTFGDTQNLTKSEDCTPCPTGFYCPPGSPSPVPCLAGTFNNVVGKAAVLDCQSCTPGRYCPTSTSSPIICAVGTYSAGGQSSCTECPAGYHCSTQGITSTSLKTTYECPAGLYCPQGTSLVPIANNNNCTRGYYCPKATPYPFPCNPGSYSSLSGLKSQDDCAACPEGFFCSGGGFDVTGECSPGYYCPKGSSGSQQTRCPGGTYNSLPNKKSLSDCLVCPAGKYCPPASISPINCPVGYYCPSGVSSPAPCPIGSYNPVINSISVSNCTICTAGRYCSSIALSSPSGPCDPGFVCPEGSIQSDPPNSLCPEGYYCPGGDSVGFKCPMGTYGPVKGLKTIDQCRACDPGFYCSVAGLKNVTGSCTAGFFCNGASAIPTQYATPAGYFTLAGASSPQPCEPGHYNPQSGQTTCLVCPEGFLCPTQAVSVPVQCPVGYFCPVGSKHATPCAPGSFNPTAGSKSSSDCRSCLAGSYCADYGLSAPSGLCENGYDYVCKSELKLGYYCLTGATTPRPIDGTVGNLCPVGTYCPAGSASPSNCPIGTFSASFGLGNVSECSNCTAGFYCATEKLSQPTGKCASGYYCPPGQSSSTPTAYNCPRNYYCPAGSSSPIPCEGGSYGTATGQDSCEKCPAGSFCNFPSGVIQQTCPTGAFCPVGSAIPIPCPAGTFSSKTGLSSANECELCSSGSICTSSGLTKPNGICQAGFFCSSGSIDGRTLAYTGGLSGICPIGFFCPQGSSAPTPCPQGTIGTGTGFSVAQQCEPCPSGSYCSSSGLTQPTGLCAEGYFCASGATTPQPETPTSTSGPCPVGNFCPAGSALPVPCPAGTYTNLYKSTSCLTCPPGFYCHLETDDPSDHLCPAGYYCPAGTASSTQNPCPPGSYNPYQKQTQCHSCSPGRYCAFSSTSSETGLCKAGYYCASNSTTEFGGNANRESTPCQAGFYCEEGTELPTPCPVGTYNPSKGAGSVGSCLSCPAGSFCATMGLSKPSGPCDGGYYCPPGMTSANPSLNTCQPGNYCPPGSSQTTKCPIGTYQDQERSTECKKCPAGYYCDTTGTIDFKSNICLEGSYCPLGTESSIQYLCPVGTYSTHKMLRSADDCTPCDPGYYCDRSGLTSPVGQCDPGYYCVSGSPTKTPIQTSLYGGLCPKGYYCPQGSSYPPHICPKGLFSISVGSKTVAECIGCPPGRYCDESNYLITEAPKCSAGYVCLGNATIPTPTDGQTGYICPIGTYCPAGSFSEIQCEPGKWNPKPGQGACEPCPAGYTCPLPGTTVPETCPAGYFCTPGLGNPLPCPAGSYGIIKGATSHKNCTQCPAGQYCVGDGSTAPSGFCEAGYICYSGSGSSTPTSRDPGNLLAEPARRNGLCPPGYYCQRASIAPQQCPPGTLMSPFGSKVTSDCQPCTPGFYCTQGGQNSPSGRCPAGFYCPVGTSSPSTNTCPSSHFCPIGSSVPTPCFQGTYQNETQQIDCSKCPSGFYCPLPQMNSPTVCPAGFYCPESSIEPTMCPPGTFSTAKQMSDVSSCISCPPGKFCTGGSITGACTKGYYCKGGSPTSTPSGDSVMSQNGPCPPGYFCPDASSQPTSCPDYLFTFYFGAASSTECIPCPAGYECKMGSIKKSLCRYGYYCESKKDPTPCPAGTYQDSVQSSSVGDCKNCPTGFFCNQTGVVVPAACPPGFYCPASSTIPLACPAGTYRDTSYGSTESDCKECPAGTLCPPGSSYAQNCPKGFYCPLGTTSPISCLPGYFCPGGILDCNPDTIGLCPCQKGHYCPASTEQQLPCPELNYCPPRTAYPIPCPKGSIAYNTTLRTSFEDVCDYCPPGSYSDKPNSLKCTICPPGYVCLEGASSSTPFSLSDDNGYICPDGHYCPLGSSQPTPCPIGTYNPLVGQSTDGSCLLCGENSFNPYTGQRKCYPCGASSSSAPGASTCSCIGKYRAYQQSDQSCICIAGYEFYDANLVLSTGDGTVDCQPVVLSRCGSNEVRLSSGACVAYSDSSCDQFCPNGGTLNADLGVCSCHNNPTVDSICNSACRANQTTLSISGSILSVSDPKTGETYNVTLSEMSWIASSLNCSETASTSACRMEYIQMGSQGFKGVYDAPMSYVKDLVSTPSTNVSRLQTRAGALSGIPNPVTCLETNEGIMFEMTSDSYPIYKKDSLYNTNKNYDWGAFRSLEEKMRSGSKPQVFAVSFSEPGIYVFEDSSDPSKETIISVMKPGQQCPTDSRINPLTTSTLTKSGVSKNSKLVQSPDWSMVGLLVGIPMGAALISLISIKAWRSQNPVKKPTQQPKYREAALEKDFGQYVSKGSQIIKQQKFNPSAPTAEVAQYEHDFWDFEQQATIEGFGIEQLYEKLNEQTEKVATEIADQSTQVKDMYDSLVQQTEKLKSVLSSKMDTITRHTDMVLGIGDMEKRMNDLKDEVERRRHIAEDYAIILHTSNQAHQAESLQRERFERVELELNETIRDCVSDISSVYHACIESSTNDYSSLQSQLQRLDNVINKIFIERDMECRRRCVWPSVNEPFGCPLVDPDTGRDIPHEYLFDMNGRLKEMSGLIDRHQRTGLYFPSVGSLMRLPSGEVYQIPIGSMCIHPDTGRVIPIEGSVCVDLGNGRLIYTHSVEPEYVPVGDVVPLLLNVINPSTGRMVDTPFKKYANKFPFPSSIIDPRSGQLVPILGVALDSTSGSLIPIGGTMIDPVTKLLRPIVPGYIYQDSATSSITSIASVVLDVVTGKAVPVGGQTVDPRTGLSVPITLGMHFIESMSGKEVPVAGCFLDPMMNQMGPMFGGEGMLLDNLEMDAVASYAAVLDEWKETMSNLIKGLINLQETHQKLIQESSASLDPSSLNWIVSEYRKKLTRLGVDFNSNNRKFEAETKAKKNLLDTIRRKNKEKTMKCIHLFKSYEIENKKLYETGGVEGCIKDSRTQIDIPIMIGEYIKDRNTGLMCPILGIHIETETGRIIPLAGTMGDPLTGETVPIILGNRMRDAETGKIVFITGVYLDEETGRVRPKSDQSAEQRLLWKEQLSLLEKEIASRNSYDRRVKAICTDLSRIDSQMIENLQKSIDGDEMADIQNMGLLQDQYQNLRNQFKDMLLHEFNDRRRDENYRNLKPEIYMEIKTNDGNLRTCSENILSGHNQFLDSAADLYKRLQAWHLSYASRLKSLEQANNHEGIDRLQQEAEKMRRAFSSELKSKLIDILPKMKKANMEYFLASEEGQMHTRSAKRKMTENTMTYSIGPQEDTTVKYRVPPELQTLVQELVELLTGQPSTVVLPSFSDKIVEETVGPTASNAGTAVDSVSGLTAQPTGQYMVSQMPPIVMDEGISITEQAIQEQIEKEDQEEIQVFQHQMDEIKQQQIAEKEREILEKYGVENAPEEQQAAVLAEHKEELHQLEKTLDMEKVRQEDHMRERLTSTRPRRAKNKQLKLQRDLKGTNDAPHVIIETPIFPVFDLTSALDTRALEEKITNEAVKLQESLQDEEENELENLKKILEERKEIAIQKMKEDLQRKIAQDSEMLEQERDRLEKEYEESKRQLMSQYDDEAAKKTKSLKQILSKKKTSLFQKIAKAAIEQSLKTKVSKDDVSASEGPILAPQAIDVLAQDVDTKRKQMESRIAEQLKMEEESAMEAIRSKMKRSKERALASLKTAAARKLQEVEKATESAVVREVEKQKIMEESKSQLQALEKDMESERQKQEQFLKERMQTRMKKRLANAASNAVDEVIMTKVSNEEELAKKKEELKMKLERQLKEEEEAELQLLKKQLEEQKKELLEKRKKELAEEYQKDPSRKLLLDVSPISDKLLELSEEAISTDYAKKVEDFTDKLKEATKEKMEMMQYALDKKSVKLIEAQTKYDDLVHDAEEKLHEGSEKLKDEIDSMVHEKLEEAAGLLSSLLPLAEENKQDATQAILGMIDNINQTFLEGLEKKNIQMRAMEEKIKLERYRMKERIHLEMMEDMIGAEADDPNLMSSLVHRAQEKLASLEKQEVIDTAELLKKKVKEEIFDKVRKFMDALFHKPTPVLKIELQIIRDLRKLNEEKQNDMSRADDFAREKINDKMEELKRNLVDKLSKADSEETRKKILEQQSKEMQSVMDSHDLEKSIYLKKLEEKYEERKRKLMEKRDKVDEHSQDPSDSTEKKDDLIREIEEEYSRLVKEEQEKDIVRLENDAKNSLEDSSLERVENATKQVLAEHKIEEAKKEIEKEVENEFQKDAGALDRKLSEESNEKIQSAEKERNALLEKASSEAEKEKILREFNEKMTIIEEQQQQEKQRQLEKLEEKKEQRRRQKSTRLALKVPRIVTDDAGISESLESKMKDMKETVQQQLKIQEQKEMEAFREKLRVQMLVKMEEAKKQLLEGEEAEQKLNKEIQRRKEELMKKREEVEADIAHQEERTKEFLEEAERKKQELIDIEKREAESLEALKRKLAAEGIEEKKRLLQEQIQRDELEQIERYKQEVQKQMQEKMAKLKEELLKKSLEELEHEDMKLKITKDVENEAQKKISDLEQKVESELVNRAGKLKSEYMEKVAGAGSEEEKKKVLQAYEQEKDGMERALAAEKQKQLQELERKKANQIQLKLAKQKARKQAEGADESGQNETSVEEKRKIIESMMEDKIRDEQQSLIDRFSKDIHDQVELKTEAIRNITEESIMPHLDEIVDVVQEKVGEQIETLQQGLAAQLSASLPAGIRDQIIQEYEEKKAALEKNAKLDKLKADVAGTILAQFKSEIQSESDDSSLKAETLEEKRARLEQRMKMEEEAELEKFRQKLKEKLAQQMEIEEQRIAERALIRVRAEERLNALVTTENEISKESVSLEDNSKRKKEQKLSELEEETENKLNMANNEDERTKIIESYEKQKNLIEQETEKERSRQEQLLAERKNARMKAKMNKASVKFADVHEEIGTKPSDEEAQKKKMELKEKIERDLFEKEQKELESYQRELEAQKQKVLEEKKQEIFERMKLEEEAALSEIDKSGAGGSKSAPVPKAISALAETQVEAEILELEAQYRESLKEDYEKRKAMAEADLDEKSLLHVKLEGGYLSIEKEAEAELNDNVQDIHEFVEKNKEEQVRELKQKLVSELNSVQAQDEKDAIISKFHEETKKIESEADAEKNRQTQLMKERLEEKKKKKALQMMKEVTSQVATSDGADIAATVVATAGAKIMSQNVPAADIMKMAEELRAALIREAHGKSKGTAQFEAIQGLLGNIPALLGVNTEDLPPELFELKPAEEMVALKDEQERLRLEMKQRQERERRVLEDQLKDEERKMEQELKLILDERTKKLKQEKAAKISAEIASQGLSKEDAERIIQEQQSELANVENMLESEKSRQSEALRSKLAEKKQKKLNEQRKKHELEMMKETSVHHQETAELQSRITKEKEQQVIDKLSENVSGEKIPEVVELVLQQRHARELQEQAAQHLLERQLKLQEFNSSIQLVHNQEQSDLLQVHQQEMNQLLKQTDIPIEEMDAKRSDLEDKQRDEMKKLESKQVKSKSEKKSGFMKELDSKQSKERFELRQKQIQEYQEMMSNLGLKLESSMRGYHDEAESEAMAKAIEVAQQKKMDAERNMQELETLRIQQEEEKNLRIQQMAEERAKFDEELKRMKDLELKKYEEELENERKLEEEKLEKALRRKKEEVLKENKLRQEKELQGSMNLSEEQKQALLDRHQNELQGLISSLDGERNRQSTMVSDRIAKKKEARKKLKGQEIEVVAKKELDEKQQANREELSKLEQKQAHLLDEKIKKDFGDAFKSPSTTRRDDLFDKSTRKDVKSGGLKRQSSDGSLRKPIGGDFDVGRPSKDGAALNRPGSAPFKRLLRNGTLDPTLVPPLLEKLGQVEQILIRCLKEVGISVDDHEPLSSTTSLSKKGTGNDGVFQEEFDIRFSTQGDLVPVEPVSMKPTHFVAYKFASFLVDLFVSKLQHEPVSIIAARSLPQTNYHRNAFKNSYYYSQANQSLFIRHQRFDSVGDLSLIVAHAMAHVKVRDFMDDTTAPFLREFYRAVSLLGEEVFYVTADASQTQSNMTNMPTNVAGLESVFNSAPTLEERHSLIGELLNVPSIGVNGPDQGNRASLGGRKTGLEKTTAPSSVSANGDSEMDRFSKSNLRKRMETYEHLLKKNKLQTFLDSSLSLSDLSRHHEAQPSSSSAPSDDIISGILIEINSGGYKPNRGAAITRQPAQNQSQSQMQVQPIPTKGGLSTTPTSSPARKGVETLLSLGRKEAPSASTMQATTEPLVTTKSPEEILRKEVDECNEKIDELHASYIATTKQSSSLTITIRKKDMELRKEVKILDDLADGSEEQNRQQAKVGLLTLDMKKLRDKSEAIKSESVRISAQLNKLKEVLEEKTKLLARYES